MEETVRLNKFLSEKGICSRREADRLVDEGKVMVNGVCAVMGQKVSSADEIVVDGKKVSTKQVKPVLIAVNKPAGIVCTTARFEGEKNIVDMVKYPTRIYPIGRLDKESEGLILMTNLGDLANEISKKTVTIYSTNLTLNTAACKHFENVQYVLLGVDKENNLLGIKPVDKTAIDEGIYPSDQLHRISIGKSYGRVSNKNFIENLAREYHLDLSDKQGLKYPANFDVVHQILTVNL